MRWQRFSAAKRRFFFSMPCGVRREPSFAPWAKDVRVPESARGDTSACWSRFMYRICPGDRNIFGRIMPLPIVRV